MTSKEIQEIIGKRIIVVANEKLEEISASFVAHGYSGISGYSGYKGIEGKTGMGYDKADDKFALKLKKVSLISFDDYVVMEVTDDNYFIRAFKVSGCYHDVKELGYGTWYTLQNFFDAFTILKVLDRNGAI